jgi:hypothetical protein
MESIRTSRNELHGEKIAKLKIIRKQKNHQKALSSWTTHTPIKKFLNQPRELGPTIDWTIGGS